eukprot:scaffold262411_cov26-Tisochrysis_lutea.AAC.1
MRGVAPHLEQVESGEQRCRLVDVRRVRCHDALHRGARDGAADGDDAVEQVLRRENAGARAATGSAAGDEQRGHVWVRGHQLGRGLHRRRRLNRNWSPATGRWLPRGEQLSHRALRAREVAQLYTRDGVVQALGHVEQADDALGGVDDGHVPEASFDHERDCRECGLVVHHTLRRLSHHRADARAARI